MASKASFALLGLDLDVLGQLDQEHLDELQNAIAAQKAGISEPTITGDFAELSGVTVGSKEIWYDGNTKQLGFLNQKEGSIDELTTKAEQFWKDDDIDADKFVAYVKSKAESSQKGSSVSWIKHAVQLANMDQPRRVGGEGEMFLQQAVFAPVSVLMYSLCPERYCADEQVNCPFVFKKKDVAEKFFTASCKPDGAIQVVESSLLMAHMELKAKQKHIREDIEKCIIMTSLSALALTQLGALTTGEKLSIPFVIGFENTAVLYATCIIVSDTGVELEVQRLYIADFIIKSQKRRFLSSFAILVLDVMQHLSTQENKLFDLAMRRKRGDHANIFSSSAGNGSATKKAKSSSNQPASKDLENSREGPSGARTDAGEREKTALVAAAQQGNVRDLQYPFFRCRVMNLDVPLWDAEADHKEDLDYYQQESPYYFKGLSSSDDTLVFCKVWKDGDRKTNRSSIDAEISFLREANLNGVPTPTLINELTALDNVGPSGTFHILTTKMLPRDDIAYHELPEYALSLIQTTRKLHELGILHCDIKPSNTAWDAKTKVVCLLDFGHAQRAVDAASYKATERYEAPEIRSEAEPHSEVTEAYSVGKTLTEIADDAVKESDGFEDKSVGLVKEIAARLSALSPADRMLLGKAEQCLNGEMSSRKRPAPAHEAGGAGVDKSASSQQSNQLAEGRRGGQGRIQRANCMFGRNLQQACMSG